MLPNGSILKDADGYAMVDLLGYEVVDYSVPQSAPLGYGSGQTPPDSHQFVGETLTCCCAVPLNLYWNVDNILITHPGDSRTIFPPPSGLRPSGWDGTFGLSFSPGFGGSTCASQACLLRVIADGSYNPGPAGAHVPVEGVVINWTIGPLVFYRDGFRGGQFDLTSKGNWNATTNTPHLTDTGGSSILEGDYYTVDVAGTIDLNSFSNWEVGDLAVFDGAGWVRVPHGTYQLTTPSPGGPFMYTEVAGVAKGLPLKNWGLYLYLSYQWSDLGPLDSSGVYDGAISWVGQGQFILRSDVTCDQSANFELYYYNNQVTANALVPFESYEACYSFPTGTEFGFPCPRDPIIRTVDDVEYALCIFPLVLGNIGTPFNNFGSGWETTTTVFDYVFGDYCPPEMTGYINGGDFISGGPTYIGSYVGSSSLEHATASAVGAVLDEFTGCGSGSSTIDSQANPNQCISIDSLPSFLDTYSYLLCTSSEASGINDLCVKLSTLSPSLITCSGLTTAGSDVTLIKSGSCSAGDLEWTGSNGIVNIQISWYQEPLTTPSSGAYTTGYWVMIITEAATLLTIWVGVHTGTYIGFDPDENIPVFGDYQEVCGSNCYATNPDATSINIDLGACPGNIPCDTCSLSDEICVFISGSICPVGGGGPCNPGADTVSSYPWTIPVGYIITIDPPNDIISCSYAAESTLNTNGEVICGYVGSGGYLQVTKVQDDGDQCHWYFLLQVGDGRPGYGSVIIKLMGGNDSSPVGATGTGRADNGDIVSVTINEGAC